MKFLVIEDDQYTADFICRGLREHGHLTEHAGNGRDGLLLAASGKYDALVIDRMLPNIEEPAASSDETRDAAADATAKSPWANDWNFIAPAL